MVAIISNEKKIQYKQNKIISSLKTGKTKHVRANTLKRFNWTGEELEFLTKHVKSAKPLEVKDDAYFERMLTFQKVSEHFQTRDTAETTVKNWISNVRVVCNASVSNFTFNHYTKTLKHKSRIDKVYTPDNEDFRKVLDLSPSELLKKFDERPVKYATSTLLSKMKVLGNITRHNEYLPAIQYLERKGNYEEYCLELKTLLDDKKIEYQSENVDAIEEVNIQEIYEDFNKFFLVEKIMRNTRNDSYLLNQEYLVALLYTIGIFDGFIGASCVGFVPRLLKNIQLKKPPPSVIDPTYKRKNGESWGGMWYDTNNEKKLMAIGGLSHKTGHTYPYNHCYIDFVNLMIEESLINFKEDIDGNPRTKLIDDRSEIISNTFSSKFTQLTNTNTKYRKFIDTVFAFIGDSATMRSTLARALGHSVNTSILVYQMKILNKSKTVAWRKKFIIFLEKQNRLYIKDGKIKKLKLSNMKIKTKLTYINN
jgi:hypothetical protein